VVGWRSEVCFEMKLLAWILEYEESRLAACMFALAIPGLLAVKGVLKIVELCKR
jgi:hypothetical protein